jgi:hypothetical protein
VQARGGPDRDPLRPDPGQPQISEEQLHQPYQYTSDFSQVRQYKEYQLEYTRTEVLFMKNL